MSEEHWKEQAKIYKDELLKWHKMFNDMHSNATEAWDSLDLGDQSDLDCAKEWFFEGFAHGNTAQLKTLTDEEILEFRDKVPYTLGSDLIDFARAILKKASENV